MEQGESVEVFEAGVISIDQSEEREQRLGPCKIDGLLVYKMANQIQKVFTDRKLWSSLVAIIKDILTVNRPD